jgi:hypothetical protein
MIPFEFRQKSSNFRRRIAVNSEDERNIKTPFKTEDYLKDSVNDNLNSIAETT